MIKQLKAATTMGAMAIALMASAPAFADNMAEMFWSARTMTAMDKNKDGMVSRQEFMDYMGVQYDKMDPKKTGMLNKAQFMDKKMMSYTFEIIAGG